MKCLRFVTKYTCCGKEKIKEARAIVSDDTPDKIIISNSPCFDCQQKMIGTRQNVIRYGNIPSCGKSYNYRDGKYEDGVSCYLLNMRPRPEFTENRKKIKISAVIIGWGGDDEPLIDVKTINQ